ncbi:MAG: iron complex outermembrane receptor protein, partial [Gammaproteobacteria bacterium]
YRIGKSRLMIRVRNLFDQEFSPWADVFYPNQIVLGSPRTFEISLYTSF